MKNYLKATILLIEKEVKENFPQQVSQQWFNLNVGSPTYDLDLGIWKPICSEPFYDLFNRGGKRIRPVLACLTHQCLEGNNPEIYKLSIIPEVIHSGTLIIDDIQDNSKLRRGKPTIHESYGISLAINLGNFLYFLPQLAIKHSKLPDNQKRKMYDLITEEMTKIHIGQGMDILWSQNHDYSISIDDYLQMCAYKTGALLSVAVKMGGILANADEFVLNELGRVAASVGTAFQIQNDISNLKPLMEGSKEGGEDITEGKLTYMVVDTLSTATDSERAELERILSSKTEDNSMMSAAISIMEKNGAFSRANKLSEELISGAKSVIKGIFDDSDYRRIYLEILDSVVGR